MGLDVQSAFPAKQAVRLGNGKVTIQGCEYVF